ncbi:Carbohydrate binding domain-containing protein [Agrobacterium fabrum]|uniref:fusion protein n=1 Tax=Agrobacterium fabrum TaxID=1176649 RepID=UPI00088F8440|nr:fusion protein [Agrobacterium fabrum]SDB14559.1 Carbohydrate binding domain-containing protein [Agrobacterium fabrum]SEQ23273.1 Carbohydrate binding domain-containing protein [Agrobacterium fabrum]
MANTTWYGDGTATVAVGSRTVTGTDTGWLTAVAGLTPIKVGDKFGIHVGRPIVIEQIISDTELLLADDWPGPAQTDAPYKIELTNPTIVAVETMRRLLASLSNGNLDSLSEITVGTDDIPIGIGPGVFSTINKAALVQGVEYDAFVANLAGRAAYNGAAQGFAVLVIDIGDGRSAIYFKNSATSGDWSAPSYVTGPVGPAGVNQRGNYSAGTAYAIRDIVQYSGSTWIAKVSTTGNAPPMLPTTENTQWLLFARSGTAGVVDRGAYSGAAAYEANDIVLDNGSTWIALQPTTGNAPPTLPTESNAYWRLLARRGTDGTGIGDVVGPDGGVALNDLLVSADTTGKRLKKAPNNVVGNALLAQLAAPAIKGRLTAGTGNVEDLTPAQANQLLGGWEAIGTLNLSGVSTGQILNLSPFLFIRCFYSIQNANTGDTYLHVSTDNGATWLSTVGNYRFNILYSYYNYSTTTVQAGDGDLSGVLLGTYLSTGELTIGAFNKARPSQSVGTIMYEDVSTRQTRIITHRLPGVVARNAIRIVAPGSNSQAEFYFEGIRG